MYHFFSISDGILAVRDPITGLSRHRQQFWKRIVAENRWSRRIDTESSVYELEKSVWVLSQTTHPDACGKGLYAFCYHGSPAQSVEFGTVYPLNRIALAPLFIRRA